MVNFGRLLCTRIETELIRRSWPFARVVAGSVKGDPVPVIVFPSGGIAIVLLNPDELSAARSGGSIAVIRRVLDEIENAVLSENAQTAVSQ